MKTITSLTLILIILIFFLFILNISKNIEGINGSIDPEQRNLIKTISGNYTNNIQETNNLNISEEARLNHLISGEITSNSNIFSLRGTSDRGNCGNCKALVKDKGNKLIINHDNDFKNGVAIGGSTYFTKGVNLGSLNVPWREMYIKGGRSCRNTEENEKCDDNEYMSAFFGKNHVFQCCKLYNK